MIDDIWNFLKIHGEWILFFGGLIALYYFLRTFIKSSVKESIRHQFEVERQKIREDFERELHTIDRKDRFRLAALDKRLAVHQEAYLIARILYGTVHDKEEERYRAQKRYSDFWENNCLYLTNEARIALQESAFSHSDYKVFWYIWRDSHGDPQATKDLEVRFDKISKAPVANMNAVDREILATELIQPDGKKISAFGIEETKKEEPK
jgi:hypothetical protein